MLYKHLGGCFKMATNNTWSILGKPLAINAKGEYIQVELNTGNGSLKLQKMYTTAEGTLAYGKGTIIVAQANLLIAESLCKKISAGAIEGGKVAVAPKVADASVLDELAQLKAELAQLKAGKAKTSAPVAEVAPIVIDDDELENTIIKARKPRKASK
jgi:hypothetical protein